MTVKASQAWKLSLPKDVVVEVSPTEGGGFLTQAGAACKSSPLQCLEEHRMRLNEAQAFFILKLTKPVIIHRGSLCL